MKTYNKTFRQIPFVEAFKRIEHIWKNSHPLSPVQGHGHRDGDHRGHGAALQPPDLDQLPHDRRDIRHGLQDRLHAGAMLEMISLHEGLINSASMSTTCMPRRDVLAIAN